MSSGRWRISVTTPDWGHDHLSSDAIVAYVDEELDAGPHLRATQHLAQCHECAAQVVAQGQARAALRTADCPSLPSSLLSSLRSIPQETDLPAAPAGLSVTPDGQFVSVMRPERAAPEQAEQAHGRRPHWGLRIGTGVAMSGLAIGAIAFGAPAATDTPSGPPPSPGDGFGRPVVGGAVSPVDARLDLAPARQAEPDRQAGPAGRPDPSAPSASPTTPTPAHPPVPGAELGPPAPGHP